MKRNSQNHGNKKLPYIKAVRGRRNEIQFALLFDINQKMPFLENLTQRKKQIPNNIAVLKKKKSSIKFEKTNPSTTQNIILLGYVIC